MHGRQANEWQRWSLVNAQHGPSKRKRWTRTLKAMTVLLAKQRPPMSVRQINGQHWFATNTLKAVQQIFDAVIPPAPSLG